MLLLVIALMYWCGKTMATTSGCYTECPMPVETLPGEYYEIDCLLRGDCSSLMFFLNNRRLNEDSDDNIFLTQYCGLGIHSLTSAYEGSYTCSYGKEHSNVLACISVLKMCRLIHLYAGNVLKKEVIIAAGDDLKGLNLDTASQVDNEHLGLGDDTWISVAALEEEHDPKSFYSAVESSILHLFKK